MCYVAPNIGVKHHSAPRAISVETEIAAGGIHKGDMMFKRIFGIAGLLCALGVLGVGAGSASAQTDESIRVYGRHRDREPREHEPAARDDHRQRGEHALRDRHGHAQRDSAVSRRVCSTSATVGPV